MYRYVGECAIFTGVLMTTADYIVLFCTCTADFGLVGRSALAVLRV